MRTLLLIVTLLFSLTFEAQARYRQAYAYQAPPMGHMAGNDGRWVTDANANIVMKSSHRHRRVTAHRPKIRVASLGGQVSVPTHQEEPQEAPPQKAEPMGEKLGAGVVVSHKTGAKANVAPQYRDVFQAYIDKLEANGGTVKFMNGRDHRGACRPPRHKHGCGWALDVCQLRRGVVASECSLPGPVKAGELAREAGLFEGGGWCNNDYGHVEAGAGVKRCPHRSEAAGRAVSLHERTASRHHKKHRRHRA